jgi:hypothetical protein
MNARVRAGERFSFCLLHALSDRARSANMVFEGLRERRVSLQPMAIPDQRGLKSDTRHCRDMLSFQLRVP